MCVVYGITRMWSWITCAENVAPMVASLEMTNGSPTLMLLLLEGQFLSSTDFKSEWNLSLYGPHEGDTPL